MEPSADQSTKKTGKTMYFLAWISAMGLLTIWFDDLLQAQWNPNDLESIEEQWQQGNTAISLQRNRYGHYVTEGLINGIKVRFMLDTGATQVSIPANLAYELNLEKGRPSQVMTANGSVTVYQTRLDTLQIGPILLSDVRAHLNPGMQGEEILLGMSALKQLEFTQRGDQLTLRQYR